MDQKLLFLMNREWVSPLLDRVMTLLSSAAFWAVPLVIVALLTLWLGGFRARVFVLLALLAFGLSDGVIGRTLKKAANRLRPHQSEVGVRILELQRPVWKGAFQPVKEKLSLGTGRWERDVEGRSFPSNHSSNTAAVALIAALCFRRGWLAFIPAFGVSWSRVYTGAHWPSDVLAGICCGLGAALVALLFAELVWHRWGCRIAPGVAASHPSLIAP